MKPRENFIVYLWKNESDEVNNVLVLKQNQFWPNGSSEKVLVPETTSWVCF